MNNLVFSEQDDNITISFKADIIISSKRTFTSIKQFLELYYSTNITTSRTQFADEIFVSIRHGKISLLQNATGAKICIPKSNSKLLMQQIINKTL